MKHTIPILIIRLEGVLQSWGDHSKWDYRDSSTIPAKSGIIGLIGCAMGIERGSDKLFELYKDLQIGIRVDNHGTLISDYHTIQSEDLRNANDKIRDEKTIVSRRTYLEDAAFTVALSGDEKLLNSIKDAFFHPKWPVYLGRKCCVPSRPIVDGIYTEYGSIEEALSEIPFSKYRKNQSNETLAEFDYIDDPNGTVYIRTDGVGEGVHTFTNRRVIRKRITVRRNNNVSEQNKA